LEGYLEEPVADRLLGLCGHEKGTVYGRQGFGYILKKAHAFEPLTGSGCGILVLTDFRDSKAECPPEALQQYLLCRNPDPSPLFLFRFAERELESWLIARPWPILLECPWNQYLSQVRLCTQSDHRRVCVTKKC
jgi:hypothetical protein